MGWICYGGCGTEVEPNTYDRTKCSNNREGTAMYIGDGKNPCEICGDERRQHYGDFCFFGDLQTFQGKGNGNCLLCGNAKSSHVGMRCYLFKNGYWGWEFGKKGRRCCACYWRLNSTPIDVPLHGFDSCRQCRRALKDKTSTSLSSVNLKDPAYIAMKAKAGKFQTCRHCDIRIEPGSKEDDTCLSQSHPKFGPTLGTEGCCLCVWLGRKQTTMPYLTIQQPLYGMHACQTCIKRVQSAARKSAAGGGWDSSAPTPIPGIPARPASYGAAAAAGWNASGYGAAGAAGAAGWSQPASHRASMGGAAQPALANPSWRRPLSVDVRHPQPPGW